MSNRQELMQRLQDSRSMMKEVVEMAIGNPSIYSPWHLKEVLDHFSGWDDAIITSLHAHAAGRVPATSAAHGIDAYNADTVSSREAIPYAHSMREWEISRQTLLKLIGEIDEEKLNQPFVFPWGETGTLARVVDIYTGHEEEHAHEIKEILQKGSA